MIHRKCVLWSHGNGDGQVAVAAEGSHMLDNCLASDMSLFYYLGLVFYYIFWVIGAWSVKVTILLIFC